MSVAPADGCPVFEYVPSTPATDAEWTLVGTPYSVQVLPGPDWSGNYTVVRVDGATYEEFGEFSKLEPAKRRCRDMWESEERSAP